MKYSVKTKKDLNASRYIVCKVPVVFLSETISYDNYFQYVVAIFTSLLPLMKLWQHNTHIL